VVGARLVLLSTTHRVAAGLLSFAAWETLRTADEVYAATADHPLAAVLDDARVLLRVPAAVAPARSLATFLVERAEVATVVWLTGPDGDPGLPDALAELLSTRAESGGDVPEVELLPGSWDVPGARLLDLVDVMHRLRSPGGCPWDAEQTHASLLPYLLEEAYETVEVIESGDLTGLQEELGDLLLQVVFHARIGEEHPVEPWSVDDVAGGIVDKLISRHPHVFADVDVVDAAEVEANWETLKRAEKGRTSAVDGVPMAQPALALAAKLLSRAQKAGVEVELPPLTLPTPSALTERAVGELLLALVAAAQSAGVDAEAALRAAARDFARQVRTTEVAE